MGPACDITPIAKCIGISDPRWHTPRGRLRKGIGINRVAKMVQQ